jgi:hypothetical protein
MEPFVSPQGRLLVRATDEPDAAAKRIAAAFSESAPVGLLHLATAELKTQLPPALAWSRDFARSYLTRLCQSPQLGEAARIDGVAPPADEELSAQVLAAPPMVGQEYLTAEALAGWWNELDALVREQIARHPGGAQEYLREKNPIWRFVGRVTFHLAENKRDPTHPFAFMATYASQLSSQGRIQHEPLGRALQQYAGAKNKSLLLSLLSPIQKAAERSNLAKELIESGDVYGALAWTPREAYPFLREIPLFEESGLVVRVPDWWNPKRPASHGERKGGRPGKGKKTLADTELADVFGIELAGSDAQSTPDGSCRIAATTCQRDAPQGQSHRCKLRGEGKTQQADFAQTESCRRGDGFKWRRRCVAQGT